MVAGFLRVPCMSKNKLILKNNLLSSILILFASIMIFVIAQVIEQFLINYDLASMYISFCAGFILFTPLVSLTLHPLLLTHMDNIKAPMAKGLVISVGLVAIVQGLFFLIWMTDAIAIYSIYVDANSFLAKAFNIKRTSVGDFSQAFYGFNLLLAWLFSLLSLTLGLLPCLIARLDNLGVVGNFFSAFSFAKKHKLALALQALCLAFSVVMPLMYGKYLFIVIFPLTLSWIFLALTKCYLTYRQ